jgi:hypothetical protein
MTYLGIHEKMDCTAMRADTDAPMPMQFGTETSFELRVIEKLRQLTVHKSVRSGSLTSLR